MRIKFKTTSASAHGSFDVGQIADVDDEFARSLIASGYAEDATPEASDVDVATPPTTTIAPIFLDGTVVHVEDADGNLTRGTIVDGAFIADPPVADPPVVDPPVADPPVADPPVADPPASGKAKR